MNLGGALDSVRSVTTFAGMGQQTIHKLRAWIGAALAVSLSMVLLLGGVHAADPVQFLFLAGIGAVSGCVASVVAVVVLETRDLRYQQQELRLPFSVVRQRCAPLII